MDAVVYTNNDSEFAELETILLEEGVEVSRDPLDGHGHYEYGFHIVVVAVDGARGMEIAKNWAERYSDSQVIWISDDPYFAGAAMEMQLHDFITRPYERDRFRLSVRRAIPKCSQSRIWRFPGTPQNNKNIDNPKNVMGFSV